MTAAVERLDETAIEETVEATRQQSCMQTRRHQLERVRLRRENGLHKQRTRCELQLVRQSNESTAEEA